jgi:hypothetical protein
VRSRPFPSPFTSGVLFIKPDWYIWVDPLPEPILLDWHHYGVYWCFNIVTSHLPKYNSSESEGVQTAIVTILARERRGERFTTLSRYASMVLVCLTELLTRIAFWLTGETYTAPIPGLLDPPTCTMQHRSDEEACALTPCSGDRSKEDRYDHHSDPLRSANRLSQATSAGTRVIPNDRVFAVMVPSRVDGPERTCHFESWHCTEAGARAWARTWAAHHIRAATVYECLPIGEVQGHCARQGEDG